MFDAWIETVRKCLLQYDEGAVMADEIFNRIVNDAVDITNTDAYINHCVNLEAARKLEDQVLTAYTQEME